MELSVIVVNYNVKYFLEQCLHSVEKALHGIDGEIIVVDNASTDGSIDMLAANFPNVVVISNKDNNGFGAANNQGVERANGEYVLFLNPDTLVQSNTLSCCINFCKAHEDVGALGVRMTDGNGTFLPESKRSFPSPAVSFYKLFGMAKLFPKSKRFGKYHLSYLNEFDTNVVDVLSGAFMFMRKDVFKEVGRFDEAYFMYGEDIDLSFQLQKAGYKNYYLPTTSIIHFKGESTKKDSISYIKQFYKAMAIFAKKNLSSKHASLFNLGVKAAIAFRALFTVLDRLFKAIGPFILDAIIAFIALYGVTELWESIQFPNREFPRQLYYVNFPLYIGLWMISCFLSGAYDKPFKTHKLLRGIILGSALVAVLYAFLPDDIRYSRMLIVLGAITIFLAFFIIRWLRHYLQYKTFDLSRSSMCKLAIVGSEKNGQNIRTRLNQLGIPHEFYGIVNLKNEQSDDFIGQLKDIKSIVSSLNINEIIFSSSDLDVEDMIETMAKIDDSNVKFKMASENGHHILGSHSKNQIGDLYADEFLFNIFRAENIRNKRILDVVSSSILLLLSPLFILVQRQPKYYFKNMLAVLFGKKSMVGLQKPHGSTNSLKQSVLSPLSHLENDFVSLPMIERFDTNYAKHYHVNQDLEILFKNMRNLGRESL